MNLHNFYKARVAPSGLTPLHGWYTFALPKLVHFFIAINRRVFWRGITLLDRAA